MSGFEALSMVCSILQVISFTKEVLTLCKDVYEGRPTTDNLMQENTTSIKVLLDEMKQCSNSTPRQTKDEKELHAIAWKCRKAAHELQKEIQRVTKYHKSGSCFTALLAGYKSKSHGRKVAGLHDRFCQYQKTLETHILVRLCTKADAIELQRREDFTNLSDTMKHLISQLAKDHTEMDHLIARDGIQTRQQIQQSEAHITQSIIDNHATVYIEAKRARLLRSLKYETMNSRRTELKHVHKATYVSIFQSLETDEEPTSSSAAAWRTFVQWLQSNNRVFWIQGKPGSGKSTLVKFLLQHENTQKGVDKWSPNTLIISHFFWKLGDVLQKNFRGLLCSLNHQLLSSEHYLVDHVLSEFRLAGDKDAIGDWEIAELESIFNSILVKCKRSILFLIDGLDEATETEEMLVFLDSLIGLGNLKLCISSRGEDIFLQRFSKHDGFRLNDLTRNDMIQFAAAELPVPDDRYSSTFIKELRNLLVDKAEGVFLWLVLALESLRRGFRNDDEQDKIRSRLSILPSKLEELYADMWSRLGEDKNIYQNEAAQYFSLLIRNQFLAKRYYTEVYGKKHQFSGWPLSPFQFMLTTDKKMRLNILDKSYQLPISEINKMCIETIKGISIKTAGLLVIYPLRNSDTKKKGRVESELSQFEEHVTYKVAFIHRTLSDFFEETKFGRNILSQSEENRIDAELAAIILCQLRVMQQLQRAMPHRKLHSNSLLRYCCWALGQVVTQDSISRSNENIALLHAFRNLFEARLLPWDSRPEWYPLPCFDVLLLANPTFKWFIKSRVDDKGASHATHLIREFIQARIIENSREKDATSPEKDATNSEESILSFGGNKSFTGDVNSTGVCLYDLPAIDTISMDLAIFDVARTHEFAAYESILSTAIKRLLCPTIYLQKIGFESMRDLEAALEEERAPDLQKNTSFLWGILYNESYSPRPLFIEMSELFYTMASIENLDKRRILQQDLMDREDYYEFIISEVNLQHLMEHFLKAIPSDFKNDDPRLANARKLTEKKDSKPHAKARFLIRISCTYKHEFPSMQCYRFINQDIDILADMVEEKSTVNEFATHYRFFKKIDDYRKQCEKVDFSALSDLADEKLGICRLEDMGIRPPSE